MSSRCNVRSPTVGKRAAQVTASWCLLPSGCVYATKAPHPKYYSNPMPIVKTCDAYQSCGQTQSRIKLCAFMAPDASEWLTV
jgi:hypothetical protein